MGTQGTGRKRSTKKDKSTAEDDALNLIAREAEARLAAKRAARAEAREIRMKELERQQKELSDDDERMSVGSRGSVRVEDRDYLEKGSRAASSLTTATLTSLGGTSSRRGSGETALTVDAETAIREIKEIHELKDQIQDVETKYTQNLKEVKDRLTEVEEKYRKAMVSNAQLDNEKNNLMYQVDTLKDSLMELEELLSESRREYEEKLKEFDREKHAHGVLQFQFNEMKETLKQSEELLNEIHQLRMKQEGFAREIADLQETVEWKDKKIGALERQKEYTDAIRTERDELREEVVKLKDILKKHGIVLGPDLNVNGDIVEAEGDGSPSGDSTCQPTQDSPMSPTEGNSVLGNTQEILLRSCGDEEVDPGQHQEIQKEEAKELSSDTLFNVDVSIKEASREEQPTEEQTCLPTVEDSIDKSGFNKDLNNDINDNPLTEAQNKVMYISDIKEMGKSGEENILDRETPEGGQLGRSNPDLLETEPKSSCVGTNGDDCGQTCNEQENSQKDAEGRTLTNTESCPQQKVVKDSKMDSSLHVVISAEITAPHHESENAEEADDDEADVPSKSQGSTAAGKKKKRKRRGKKKVNIQKERTESDKAEVRKSAEGENGSTSEPNADSVTKMEQVENEQDEKKSQEMGAAKLVETNESLCLTDSFKGLKMDHITDDKDHTEAAEETVVAQCEMLSHKELKAEPEKNEQDEEQPLEMDETGKTSPSEAPVGTSDLNDTSNITERTDVHDRECIDSVDNAVLVSDVDSKSMNHADEMGSSGDGIIPESTAEKQEYSPDNEGKENIEAESLTPGNSDVGGDVSESTNNPERQHFTDDLTDCLEGVSLSEPPTLSDDTPTIVVDKDLQKASERIKNEEELEMESKQEDFPSTVNSHHDADNSEFKPDETQEEELNRDLREPEEDAAASDSSTHNEKSVGRDSVSLTNRSDIFDTGISLLETEGQDENADATDRQILEDEEQGAKNPGVFDTEKSLLETKDQKENRDDVVNSQILEDEEQGAKSLLETKDQKENRDHVVNSQILEDEEQGSKSLLETKDQKENRDDVVNSQILEDEEQGSKSLLENECKWDVNADARVSQMLDGKKQATENPDVFETEKTLLETKDQKENRDDVVNSQILEDEEQGAESLLETKDQKENRDDVVYSQILEDEEQGSKSLLKNECQDVNADARVSQMLDGKKQATENPDVFETEKTLLETKDQKENAYDAVNNQTLEVEEQEAKNPDTFDTEKILLEIDNQDGNANAGDSPVLEGEELAAENPDVFDIKKSLLETKDQKENADHVVNSQILEVEEQEAKNPDTFDTEKILLETEEKDENPGAIGSQILEVEEQGAQNPGVSHSESLLKTKDQKENADDVVNSQILESEEHAGENPGVFGTEKILLETEDQEENADAGDSQVLECEERADKSNAVSVLETGQVSSTDVLSTPDSLKDAADLGSCLEPYHSTGDSGVAEDPDSKMCPNVPESETCLHLVTEQLHESSKDESKDDSSQPVQQGSDDEEDEEGQSFDFDDMDIDAAVESIPEEEENVTEGVEVKSDGSRNSCPQLCQSKSETHENAQSKETGGNNEKSKVDECNQVHTLNTESGTSPNSVAHEEATLDGERHMTKEDTVLNVGNVGILENINQATSLPVEEGLDAIKHEMQGENVVLPKSADQVANKKESQHSGKDVKKNVKKGKGKSKEDCKMS